MEGVDQLMAENVVGLAEASGEGKDDAATVVLGDTADALAQEALDDVRLDELRVARVHDDRLALGELMVERGGQPIVPALGQPRRAHRRVVFGGVVQVKIRKACRRR